MHTAAAVPTIAPMLGPLSSGIFPKADHLRGQRRGGEKLARTHVARCTSPFAPFLRTRLGSIE